MAGQQSYPSPAFGYWRGGGPDGMPLWKGQGSGMGLAQQGIGVFSAGQGPPGGSSSGWEPTVIYLLLLIVGEMLVFGLISRMLR